MRPIRFAVLVAAVGLGLVAALAFTQPGSPIARLIQSECTVGLAGTALSVTFKGGNASDECAAMQGMVGPDGATWYRYEDEEPPGVLMCRHTVDDTTVTVRDQGSLMLYGSATCEQVEAQAYEVADAGSESVWYDQQQERYDDPAVIRCDDLTACAQDVNPFPLAPADGLDWCVAWTDESEWRYGAAFLSLRDGEQEAVRGYCERGERPVHLPDLP